MFTQPPDSCDASGEYTEDSSDEDRASLSSEDVHNCSVATYREVTTALGCSHSSVSGSNEAILDQDTPERAPRLPFGLGMHTMGAMGHSDSGSSAKVRCSSANTLKNFLGIPLAVGGVFHRSSRSSPR